MLIILSLATSSEDHVFIWPKIAKENMSSAQWFLYNLKKKTGSLYPKGAVSIKGKTISKKISSSKLFAAVGQE